jgi:hypothetical protein
MVRDLRETHHVDAYVSRVAERVPTADRVCGSCLLDLKTGLVPRVAAV